ncbi:MAG: hypothetical protein AAGA83_05700 [Cyanobacteria bacterium P01_F01_bin.116]
MDEHLTNHQKNKNIAAVLAFLGALQPTPVPFAGIHKFYLGQYGWGLVYMVLGMTQVPRIASAAEGLWYLVGVQVKQLGPKLRSDLDVSIADKVSAGPNVSATVDAVASSLREIEQLRQEGLLSEYEFEQKRRSLLEQMP